MMIWTVWFLVAALFVMFEIMVSSLIFFCFAVGSIFAAIISCFTDLSWVGFAVFGIVSVASLCFVRPIFKKLIGKCETINSNVDAFIGENAIVVEKIMPTSPGLVKVLGEIWRAESNVKVEVGEMVKIKCVKGTTVVVDKQL